MNKEIIMIEGRIEAFEFMAKQFRVYADDNDEIHKRYGTSGKAALAVAKKRSETWRAAAEDCERYANEQTAELIKLRDQS